MAGGKQTPRQKMINMMYLVLTAMLALNVSKEILDAFVVVNIGLLQQRDNLTSKNSNMYVALDGQVKTDPKNPKLKFLNDEAVVIGSISKELSEYIKSMKVELVSLVDGAEGAEEKVENPSKVEKKDDYDKPTHYFGTNDDSRIASGKARELRTKLEEYKGKLMVSVEKVLDKYVNNDARKKEFKEQMLQRLGVINLEDPEAGNTEGAKTWETKYFYHLPLSAALTELTKWENIVKGAESEVLTFLWDQISATAFKFDAVEAKIIPKSTFVISGGSFEAEVFLAAYSTSSKPTVIIGTGVDSVTKQVVGGVELTADKIVDGKGLISVPASGSGERTVAGIIQLPDPTGQVQSYTFTTSFNVSPPSATVAPTKMNVFYRGLDNPLSVSVPGVAPNNITVSCSNGSISGSGGQYIVKPGGGNECVVNVSAKMPDGSTSNMGQHKFRVKRVPTPQLEWAGVKSGGQVEKNQASLSPVIPRMEDFDFDVYATIASLVIGFNGPGGYKEYNSVNEASAAIKKLGKGTKVYIDAKVTVPGGERRSQSGIFLIK